VRRSGEDWSTASRNSAIPGCQPSTIFSNCAAKLPEGTDRANLPDRHRECPTWWPCSRFSRDKGDSRTALDRRSVNYADVKWILAEAVAHERHAVRAVRSSLGAKPFACQCIQHVLTFGTCVPLMTRASWKLATGTRPCQPISRHPASLLRPNCCNASHEIHHGEVKARWQSRTYC